MTPDEMRANAAEQRALANKLIDADKLDEAQNLISAIVGHVNATVLETGASVIDAMNSPSGQPMTRREKFDAIRLAVANGDWDEFDRLAGTN